MKIRTLEPRTIGGSGNTKNNTVKIALLLPFIMVGVLELGIFVGTLQHRQKMVAEDFAHYDPRTGEYVGGKYDESAALNASQICKGAGKFEKQCYDAINDATK